MAYTLIATQTLTAATGTVTFSNIPGTFKDLVLECYMKMTTTNIQPALRFNSDSGTNYSGTYVQGDGTTTRSGRGSSQTYIYPNPGVGISTNTDCVWLMNIQSYANTNVNKTIVTRFNSNSVVDGHVGLWRSTAAINAISLVPESGNFDTNSTFKLWGVS